MTTIVFPLFWAACGSGAGVSDAVDGAVRDASRGAMPVAEQAPDTGGGSRGGPDADGATAIDTGIPIRVGDATAGAGLDAAVGNVPSPWDATDMQDVAASSPNGARPETGAPYDSGLDAGNPAPANPNASPGVRSLLRFLKSVEGKKVVTGQLGWWHQGWCSNPDPSLWPFVLQQTSRTPAIYGGEIWTSDVAAEPAKLIQMWNARTLVTIQWHAPNPAIPGSTAWIGAANASAGTPNNPGLSPSQWKDIVTPGTALYSAWLAAIDATAGVLKQLRDAGVTVIWRPLHESHGGWFWWGTTNRPAGALATLYQMMFDRYTNYHGLNNLVWNWSTGGTNLQSMYPGAGYVDIISMDAYGGPLAQDQYQAMLSFGKLAAWGEWGLDNSQTYVTPTWILANQPKIVYVMQWYGTCTSGSASPASYLPFFTDPNGVDSPVTLP